MDLLAPLEEAAGPVGWIFKVLTNKWTWIILGAIGALIAVHLYLNSVRDAQKQADSYAVAQQTIKQLQIGQKQDRAAAAITVKEQQKENSDEKAQNAQLQSDLAHARDLLAVANGRLQQALQAAGIGVKDASAAYRRDAGPAVLGVSELGIKRHISFIDALNRFKQHNVCFSREALKADGYQFR